MDRLAPLHKQTIPVYIVVIQVSKVLVQLVSYPSEMRE